VIGPADVARMEPCRLLGNPRGGIGVQWWVLVGCIPAGYREEAADETDGEEVGEVAARQGGHRGDDSRLGGGTSRPLLLNLGPRRAAEGIRYGGSSSWC